MDRPRQVATPLSVAQLFNTEGPYVVRALRYFGVPESDLADGCQDVFIVVHRKLDSFEQRSAIRTWLYRICQRVAADRRRRAHTRRELVTDTPITERATDDRTIAERSEARALLLEALEALDEDKRVVFVLYEIEGLSMKEVAEVIGCPLQTAYSRLHAARQTMAARVTSVLREGVA